MKVTSSIENAEKYMPWNDYLILSLKLGIIASSSLLLAGQSFAEQHATTLYVTPPAFHSGSALSTSASVETYTATMPSSPIGSSLQATLPMSGPQNLGTFNIQINAGAGLSANPAALAAFQRAADSWESWISDPINIVIDADFPRSEPAFSARHPANC